LLASLRKIVTLAKIKTLSYSRYNKRMLGCRMRLAKSSKKLLKMDPLRSSKNSCKTKPRKRQGCANKKKRLKQIRTINLRNSRKRSDNKM